MPTTRGCICLSAIRFRSRSTGVGVHLYLWAKEPFSDIWAFLSFSAQQYVFTFSPFFFWLLIMGIKQNWLFPVSLDMVYMSVRIVFTPRCNFITTLFSMKTKFAIVSTSDCDDQFACKCRAFSSSSFIFFIFYVPFSEVQVGHQIHLVKAFRVH